MSIRAFIAVDFEASHELLGLIGGLRSSRARLRVVPPENLHITLKFLGGTEEGMVEPIVEVMETSVEGVAPFTLTLRGTGGFPSLRAPRVLWVGIHNGEPMSRVAQQLELGLAKLGFPRERRRFSPHLTLARVKGPQGRDDAVRLIERQRDTEFGLQSVEAIKLKRSELRPTGAVYSDIATVALG